MTAEEILVIILSSALAVFLLLAIILTIMLIVIVKKINRVVAAAERTVDNVETFVTNVQGALAPAAVGSFFMDMLSRLSGRRKKDKEDD